MARPPRPLIAGGVYHVYNRGVVKLPIFVDTLDRVRFLRGLAEVVDRGSWSCLAYCLMGNHFHLLGPHARAAISTAACNGCRASTLSRSTGATIERAISSMRGTAATVLDDDDLIRYVTRYIVQNPVAAGLCRPPR